MSRASSNLVRVWAEWVRVSRLHDQDSLTGVFLIYCSQLMAWNELLREPKSICLLKFRASQTLGACGKGEKPD